MNSTNYEHKTWSDFNLCAPSMFIGIGTKAAIYLGKQLPEDTQFAYCMVANADELQASGILHGIGVGTDISLEDQFQLISQAMPHVKSIGMLYRSDNSKSRQNLVSVQNILQNKWALKTIDIAGQNSISDAIKKLCRQRIDLIWTSSDASVYTPAVIRSLLLASLRKGIPVFGFSIPFVKAGALLGVGINPTTQGKQVAQVVSNIVSSNSLPTNKAESNAKFEIGFNLIVAKRLGIKIPQSAIAKASKIYQEGNDSEPTN